MSNNFKVQTSVLCHEINDKKTPINHQNFVTVKNHSHENNFMWRWIVITDPAGNSFTVQGDDLVRAIENALNQRHP